MVTKKTEKKKTIANVVKTIIKKGSVPARKTVSRKAKPSPDEMTKDAARTENIKAQPAPEPVKPKKDSAAPIAGLKLKEPTTEEISARAYLIWEREGRPNGCSDRHWQQAMQELQGANN